jgi:steroid delta-isomerase-like uncharacterized protein
MTRIFDELNQGNAAVLDETLAPDFVSYGAGGTQNVAGAAAFKQFFLAFLAAFPDLYIDNHQTVASGNKVAVRGTLSGTHQGNFMGMAPATGKKITWTGIAIFEIENGRCVRRWAENDDLSFMTQLGVIPPMTEAAA